MRDNLNSILFFISGFFFFIYAIMSNNYSFWGLGICFIVLGINNYNDKKDKK